MSSLSSQTTDYIIIGQGLAGSVLALQLLWEGQNIVVIDQASLSSSSRIAPGIINPIVFKRFIKSWRADEALHSAETFYIKAEQFLKESFFHKKDIVKFFTEEQEKELWRKKAVGEEGVYLSEEVHNKPYSDTVTNEGGYALVKGSGNLDTVKFLKAVKNYLVSRNVFNEETVDYSSIVFNPDKTVSYKGINAKQIIFCEGYRVVDNPYFNWLPMKLAKGEVLTVQVPGLNLQDKIISKGISILPCGGDIYKVGSTFDWDDLDEKITKKALEELTGKLKKIISLPFTVIRHHVGVRPAVNHRRPLLGFHPQHPQLAVFNGLGTKGVMLAPMCSEEMMKALKGEAIYEDFNIQPYYTEAP